MIETLSADVISGLLGGIGGFVMKYLAQRAADVQAAHLRALELLAANDTSADKADKRDSADSGGRWTRRFIVLMIMIAFVGALILMPIINIPIAVEGKNSWSFLWGLFESAKPVFTEVRGYLFTPELRQMALAMVWFYLGSSVTNTTK